MVLYGSKFLLIVLPRSSGVVGRRQLGPRLRVRLDPPSLGARLLLLGVLRCRGGGGGVRACRGSRCMVAAPPDGSPRQEPETTLLNAVALSDETSADHPH